MTAPKPPVCRAEFMRAVIDAMPSRSRARELVETGLIDRAALIAEFAHDLADAAIAAMEAEILERRCDVASSDLRSLRGAAFEGIAHNIICRLYRGHRGRAVRRATDRDDGVA